MVNLTSQQKHLPLTRPKRVDLPTMYDLPSEEVGEPGLPDQYHPVQAQLLEETFQPRTYPSEQVFSAMDLNIYYDENNTTRYKRPDWFGVAGVSRLYEAQELRISYVVWQEGVNPFIVVELLSPSTQREDMGQTLRDINEPPTKWQVYEQFLQVPYYVVYNRERDSFRAFHLEENSYQELELANNQLWLEELELGLGLWQGNYKGFERLWLRFYDNFMNWIPTPAEREQLRADQERLRAEQEQVRADREQVRADQEQVRAEQERLRAEQEQVRADREQVRADRERLRAESFKRLLIENGINPDEVE